MADHTEDHYDDVAPKGGHASANPEPAPLAAHVQREGADGRAEASLQGSGEDGGARSDADREVADVDVDMSVAGTGTHPQSGGSQGERTGG